MLKVISIYVKYMYINIHTNDILKIYDILKNNVHHPACKTLKEKKSK